MASRKDKKKAGGKGSTFPPAREAAPKPAPLDRREMGLAAVIALGGALLWVLPVFSGIQKWGANDWDQHQVFYGHPFWSLRELGQLPFWNPFLCGGNPGLADPQSVWLNPLFAVVLALGVLPGLKVLIWLHAAIAIWGAWLLGRRLGCGRIAAWLPAAAFGMSSSYALHVSTGHSTWFAMAWLPLGLCALHAAFERPAWGLAGGAAVAMTLFVGNAYLFAYFFLFAGLWGAAVAVQKRSWTPLVGVAVLCAAGAGFAAVKALPVQDFLGKVTTPEVGDPSVGNVDLLWAALLGREQTLRAYDLRPVRGMIWRWWEYGSYLGPVVMLGAIGHALRRPRRAWPMAFVVLFALLLSMGNGWGVWDVLRRLPVFEGLRVPSRAIVVAALFLGVMAGLAFTEWEGRYRPWIAAAVALAALDIGWVSRGSYGDVFILEPLAQTAAPYRQLFGKKDFQHAYDPVQRRHIAAYSDMYPSMLAGVGTINCYDRLRLPRQVQPAQFPNGQPNPGYHGEAWVDGAGSAKLVSMGGRRITVELSGASGKLVVNQNWDDGWRAEDGRPLGKWSDPAPQGWMDPQGGLLAVEVRPEDKAVVLVYTPPRMMLGLLVTLLTLGASAAFVLAPWLRRRFAQSPAPGDAVVPPAAG